MKYRGFELKPIERVIPPHGIVVRGIGIFRNDEGLTYAHDYDLAKRTVDEHLKSGIWRKEENQDGR